MRRRTSLLLIAVAVPLTLSACSDKKTTGASSTTTADCKPVAGSELVVLADDKHLQSSDNITPVVRTEVAKEPLTTVLNEISAALTQDKLLEINRDADIDRKTADQIATAFIADNGIAKDAKGGSGKIAVVAAGFSESTSLATIYAKALGAAGYSASVKQSTNREVYLPALEKGEVQVAPEYAATLTLFLDKQAKTSGDITETIAVLKPLAAAKGLTVLNPAPATDQNAFAVTKTFADKLGVKTLSELAAKCPNGIKLGGPTELQTRPYGASGLQSTYGLKVAEFVTEDTGGPLTKNALKAGTIAVGLVFSSDSSLGTL
jgi:osmoprotectant transport system substrate-binding protein